mgnify:CR=1 FL=1
MKQLTIPYFNLRGSVIFPKTSMGLFIGRETSIQALQFAKNHNRGQILVISQKRMEMSEPKGLKDMHKVGIICKILNGVLLPDRTMKVALEGETLFQIQKLSTKDGTGFAQGWVLNTDSKIQKISEQTKEELIELLVRLHPVFALQKKQDILEHLAKKKKSTDFVNSLLKLSFNSEFLLKKPKAVTGAQNNKLPTPAQMKIYNDKVTKQLQILQEQKFARRLDLIRNLMKDEIVRVCQDL